MFANRIVRFTINFPPNPNLPQGKDFWYYNGITRKLIRMDSDWKIGGGTHDLEPEEVERRCIQRLKNLGQGSSLEIVSISA